MVWHIVLAVGSGVVVAVCVDAEDTEVARLAWPHPVVCVAAIFAEALWGCIDETHVVVALVDGEEVFAAFVEGVHLALYAFSAVVDCFGEEVGDGVNDKALELEGCIFWHKAEDIVCDVYCLEVEEHIEVFVGQLIFVFLGYESIFEVVVLCSGVGLNGTISAVVVGEYKSLV